MQLVPKRQYLHEPSGLHSEITAIQLHEDGDTVSINYLCRVGTQEEEVRTCTSREFLYYHDELLDRNHNVIESEKPPVDNSPKYAAMPHGNMLFCYSPNAEDFQKRLDSLTLPCGGTYPERSGGQCSTFHHETSTEIAVIVCLGASAFANPVHLLACLVHEATHVKQEYMAHLGENPPSAEFEAYTMDFIVQELLQQIEDTHGKEFSFSLPLAATEAVCEAPPTPESQVVIVVSDEGETDLKLDPYPIPRPRQAEDLGTKLTDFDTLNAQPPSTLQAIHVADTKNK